MKYQVEKNANEISSLKEEMWKLLLETEMIGLKERLDAYTLNAECLEEKNIKDYFKSQF